MDTDFHEDMRRLIERLYPRLTGRYSCVSLTFSATENLKSLDVRLTRGEKDERPSIEDAAKMMTSPLGAAFRQWRKQFSPTAETESAFDNARKWTENPCDENLNSLLSWLCPFKPTPKRSKAGSELANGFAEILFRELLCDVFPKIPPETLLYSKVSQVSQKSQDIRRFQLLAVSIDKSAKAPVNPDRDKKKKRSFLQQAIHEMFKKWTILFKKPNYYLKSAYIPDIDSLIELTAKDVTEGRGIPSYKLYHELSAATYESRPCYGTVVFAENEDDEVGLISFKGSDSIPFQTENARLVRKLLTMTEGRKKSDYALCARRSDDKFTVAGLIPRSLCDRRRSVEFNGHTNWTLKDCGKEVISYEKGRFCYKKTSFNEEYKRLRDFLGKGDITVIREIVKTLWKQQDGAMLVIFPDGQKASDEIKRLAELKQGTELEKPISFQAEQGFRKELLFSLSCVDGAIFMNGNFEILGFGVIVDGAAAPGSTTRGSRYNSANAYVQSCGAKAAALVISEDRSLDLLCLDDEWKRQTSADVPPETKANQSAEENG